MSHRTENCLRGPLPHYLAMIHGSRAERERRARAQARTFGLIMWAVLAAGFVFGLDHVSGGPMLAALASVLR